MPLSVDASRSSSMSPGYIEKIPVRNIWLLLLYASDLYREIGTGRVKFENNPDDIADLIAEFLIHHVEKRLRRNLSLGYQRRSSHLRRVRGRIDLIENERHKLLLKGQIACRFDDLTIDTRRNRFIKGALKNIAGLVKQNQLKYKSKSLVNKMSSLGVSSVTPSIREMSLERYGKFDIQDKIIVSAAKLAFELQLPTEFAGDKYFAIPNRDIVWFRKLFEKAIGGFYKVVLNKSEWIVNAGKQLKWDISDKTPMIDSILSTMFTDIIIDNKKTNKRIIIDTKFNEIFTSAQYRDKTIRSGYIYQIYAYLRSQEKEGDVSVNHASGILLHPAIGYSVNESVTIQNHQIRFVTVDLTLESGEIRQQLLEIISGIPAAVFSSL